MSLLEVIAVASSAVIIVFVVYLIRRGSLIERYALLWLVASVVLLVLSLWRGLLDAMAEALGFYYPPAFLFLAAFVFLMLILLHFSVFMSKLRNKNKDLAQEIGLIKLRLEELSTKADTRGE